MNFIFSPIDKRQLIHEIAEEVTARIIPQLQPPAKEEELIRVPEAMEHLERSHTTINNWREEDFLKEQVIKRDVVEGGRDRRFLVKKLFWKSYYS